MDAVAGELDSLRCRYRQLIVLLLGARRRGNW
jgi:hypothetical protein